MAENEKAESAPVEREAKPWEEPRVTPEEAIEVLERRSYLLESDQRVLVLAGLRQSEYAPAMRDAFVLNYTADYLRRVLLEKKQAVRTPSRSPTGAQRR